MKKLLLISIVLLAFTSKAHASVYKNQATTTTIASSVTSNIGLTKPVKQGSLLLLCIQIIGTRSVSIVDNMSNTWQLAASSTSVTSARQMYVFYVQNATAGFTNIDVTTTGASIGKRIVATEYVGINPISAFNASSTNAQDAQTYGNTGTVSSSGSFLTTCFGTTGQVAITTLSPWVKQIGQPDTVAPNVFIQDAITSSSTPSGYVIWGSIMNYTSALVTWNVASVPKFFLNAPMRIMSPLRI